ncbi:ABC transporter permease subunit [Paenibacillus sp. RC67]|uniref:ABC transporter permease n=1 Tax=Paenibacillus sp. RC67 TaxID=3039392 RepID=UPI0024AC95BB|nr:ABC transporter permease subunit [Paenibacillus sp. RC67]
MPAGSGKSSLSLQRRRKLKQNLPLLIMFVPVIAFYLIFKYAPMVGVIVAFKSYNFADGIFGSPWVGLKNFHILFSNPKSLLIIRNTLVLSLMSIFIGFPFPIMLAIMLNEVKKIWFKKTVQTLVFLPHFLSWVIVGGMVVTIFSQESGVINHWIQQWTGSAFPFLYNETSWMFIFVGSGIWKEAGFSAIVYLAALSSIDTSLYEAASIDGAGKWKQMWHITLPGIAPTIVLMLILSMGKVMEVGFDHVYTLQNSVVSNVSEVISTYIYTIGLQKGQFSLTSAMGLFESVVGFILVITANTIARKFNRGIW